MITGTTLWKLTGNSNPLRANSASAKHPPCHEPSPYKYNRQGQNQERLTELLFFLFCLLQIVCGFRTVANLKQLILHNIKI